MKLFLHFIFVAAVTGSFSSVVNAGNASRDSRPEISRELLRQIQSDFLQLSQPLNFTVEVKDSWAGIDSLQRGFGASPGKAKRVVLSGDALEFKDKYPLGAIAIALRPYFKDSEHDAEAYIMMAGAMGKNMLMKFTSFRSRKEPGDWAEVKDYAVDIFRPTVTSTGMDTYHWSITAPAYKVKSEEMLPSSLKKKTRWNRWFSRLFR